MKTRILHWITFLLKFISGLLVLSPAVGNDTAAAGWGVVLFIAASALKDLLIALGDWLDDGKRNGSFRVPLIAFALCSLLLLSGCENSKDGRRFELSPLAIDALNRVTSVGIDLAEDWATMKLRDSLRIRSAK